MSVTAVSPSTPPVDTGNRGPAERDAGASDSGFASMLAGVRSHDDSSSTHRTDKEPVHHDEPSTRAHKREPAAAPKPAETGAETARRNRPADRHDSGEATRASTSTPAPAKNASDDPDPAAHHAPAAEAVTAALLAALAATMPTGTAAAGLAPPGAGTATESVTPAPAAGDAKPAIDLAATAPRTLAEPAAPNPAPAAPTVATATATVAASASTTADATVAAAAEAAAETTATAGRANAPGAPGPKPPAPGTAGKVAADPTPAAPTTTHPAADAADTAAAAPAAAGVAGAPNVVAGALPTPRTGTAAKNDAGENAMISAAGGVAERAPSTEAPTAATAPAAPAAAPPPAPAAQLAAVIRPLQRNADGNYQIRIEMRPPELGRVDMRVEIRDGVLHASIHAEHAQTADLVRNALDDLRARLDADGLRSGQFTVDSQGAGTSGRDAPANAPERIDDTASAASDPIAVAGATTHSDSLLDVRI